MPPTNTKVNYKRDCLVIIVQFCFLFFPYLSLSYFCLLLDSKTSSLALLFSDFCVNYRHHLRQCSVMMCRKVRWKKVQLVRQWCWWWQHNVYGMCFVLASLVRFFAFETFSANHRVDESELSRWTLDERVNLVWI